MQELPSFIINKSISRFSTILAGVLLGGSVLFYLSKHHKKRVEIKRIKKELEEGFDDTSDAFLDEDDNAEELIKEQLSRNIAFLGEQVRLIGV